VFEGGAGQPACHGTTRALFAHRRANGDRIKPDQSKIHAGENTAMGEGAITAAHRTRFRIAHDGADFILAAEVDEDLLGTDGNPDTLNVYFDCRPEEGMRKGPYAAGTAWLKLIPGLSNGEPRVESAAGQGIDIGGARILSAAREGGYTIDFRIPLSALNLPEGQRVFGFDLAQESVDAGGVRDALLLWSGNWANSSKTNGFGIVYLEK
jgi:hypothetical protein